MLSYCERDVDLLELVYNALTSRMRKIGYSELSAEIEHRIRYIIDQQEQNGCYFDTKRAKSLHQQLRLKQSNLAEPIQKLFPAKLEEVGTYTLRRKKDGSHYSSYERHLRDYPEIRFNEDGTEYTTYEYRDFNIGSPQQRLERLLELGFEPTSKTKKGNPKVDEDSLVAFAKESGRLEVQAMSEWLVLQGRCSMLLGNPEKGTRGWIDYVKPDHRIHGRVLTCGASSRRMTHFQPNTANAPSAQNGAAYGDEMRSLWSVTPDLGRIMVGYDAKGLETAVLLHCIALGAPKDFARATELLLHGDVHQLNADALAAKLGFSVVRGGGGAKTAMYSTVFGAYPKRLGSIVKKGSKEGEIIKRVIYDNVPGLERVTNWAQDNYQHNDGLIKTIDGGYVRCPSEHAALNYNIQPNGGVLMKYTSILLNKRTKEKGLWHMKIIDCHDESQHETDQKDAEELGKLAIQCIEDAGEELGFKVKMTGSYKIGSDWSKTH